MLTKKDIEVFFNDLNRLGLKFPVASLSESLDYSMGTVSRILKSGQPSEKFVKKFYEVFRKQLNELPSRPMSSSVQVPGDEASLLDLVVALREYETAVDLIKRKIYDLTSSGSGSGSHVDQFGDLGRGTESGGNRSGRAN